MALRSFAEENAKALNEIGDAIYPVAISLDDSVCIQLKPLVGWLGSAQTYCYRKDTTESNGVSVK